EFGTTRDGRKMNTGSDPRSYRSPPNNLRERIILVTGASDGIGKALALATAGLGAQVILHGRNQAKLEAVHDEIVQGEVECRPSIAVMDLATAGADAYQSLADSIDSNFGR